jgi:hypothetical protein
MKRNRSNDRFDDVFNALLEKLPYRYMAELQKLLPDLKDRKISYAMEKRCKDHELKVRVKAAMVKAVKIHSERQQELASPPVIQ